ncbi:MAG: ribosome small subunit-dependent GTPase A [Candidimonas sp.]|nr:MAG: ribosome small subunit-dependent GTPase A [Candidimonas sp.]TAM19791.1 MAG: ribosome small subunit-dependent GTPase A [Candidimonas sp.]TAM79008.1 MAG: ribosome small subunit-dependent GTPase A [Candidimonas sp.]
MVSATRLQGRIVAAHGRHYTVELADGSVRKCFPRGKKAGAAVGDFVQITPEGEHEGAIEKIEERSNLLYRSDDMRTKQFAANVDQLLLVVAVEPAFSDNITGRALVAARSANIEPLIILNKIDLASGLALARQRLASLRKLSVRIIELSAQDPAHVRGQLLPEIEGRTNLLLGQSGMGKSTLLNILIPDARANTQEHSVALGTGKHTTTSTRLYRLPERDGSLIDSPGFQTFGLYHLSKHEIEQGFPEFTAGIAYCRFYNCTHRHEPGCGVLAALEHGDITPERHALYKRILAENETKNSY